jgi:hypothetical protein
MPWMSLAPMIDRPTEIGSYPTSAPQMNLWPETINTLKRVIRWFTTFINTFSLSGIEFIRWEEWNIQTPTAGVDAVNVPHIVPG